MIKIVKRIFPLLAVVALMTSCGQKERALLFQLHEYEYDYVEANPDTVDFRFSIKIQLPVSEGLSKSERAAVATMHSSLLNLLLAPYYVDGTDPDEALVIYCDSLRTKVVSDNGGVLDNTTPWYYKLNGGVELVDKYLVVYSCSTEEWTGFPHPYNSCYYLLYDRRSGQLLEEEDIFDFTEENQRAIAEIMQQNYVSQCRKDSIDMDEVVIDINEILPNGNFEARPDEIIYHYDPYDLGNYNGGVPVEVHLPSYQLVNYMKKESALYRYWFKH